LVDRDRIMSDHNIISKGNLKSGFIT